MPALTAAPTFPSLYKDCAMRQADLLHATTAAAAGKAKPFLGRRLYIDLRYVDFERSRHVLAHLVDVRAHLRRLGDDRRIDIFN